VSSNKSFFFLLPLISVTNLKTFLHVGQILDDKRVAKLRENEVDEKKVKDIKLSFVRIFEI
jgi:hypothetical protein